MTARHYAGIHPALDRQFYENVDRLLREIRRQPTAFRMFAPPARRHFGPRFPYAIVYLDMPDCIWIVAIMHFKQRPEYWAKRLA